MGNQNQDYSSLGGWLLLWYWCLFVGGILMILSMVLPALLSIAASLVVGLIYTMGVLVSVVSVCASAVFDIKAAFQLKAKDPRFFDTFVFGTLASIVGGILSRLLMIRSISGIAGFIGSTVGSCVGFAFSICLCIMYFSKSVRVDTYFGGNPLSSSRYWDQIRKLPDTIISR